jgi:hypothetical protein
MQVKRRPRSFWPGYSRSCFEEELLLPPKDFLLLLMLLLLHKILLLSVKGFTVSALAKTPWAPGKQERQDQQRLQVLAAGGRGLAGEPVPLWQISSS